MQVISTQSNNPVQYKFQKPAAYRPVMIKSDNPSREELLNELVSIRDSLLPESDKPHSTSDKPSSALTKTNEPPHTPSKPTQTETTHDKDEIMDPLPGQQSLFDENAKKIADAAKKKSATEPKKAQKSPSTASKASTTEQENPFLPHHIKQKLEKEKFLYQQEISKQNNLQSTQSLAAKSMHPITATSPTKPLTSNFTKNAMVLMEVDEALVDELVEIYLPKIEQDLRQRLRERLKRTT